MKKSNVFYMALTAVFLIIGLVILAGCGSKKSNNDGWDTPGGGGGDKYNSIIFFSADGSSTQSTTQLIIIVNQPIPNFSADDITLSGVPGVTKGDLSDQTWISSYERNGYILPISGFRTSGTLTVKVGSRSWSVDIYYSAAQEGIYLGIIKFAGVVKAINLKDYEYSQSTSSGAPVYLDQNVNSYLSDVLNYGYSTASANEDGSAVYYAVHKALANLKSYESSYPDNPDSVYVITFTDGKDNGSAGQSLDNPIENKPFETTANYITYVKDQIANRKIAGKSITAYSIGVKGNDIVSAADQTNFTNLLMDIASPENNRELDNYDDVQSTFDEIADGLIQGSNFTLSTTLLESGTKVRMTFDITSSSPTPTEAAGSTKYIEGTVTRSGQTYTLTNITYKGITSDAGAGPITGTRDGSQVKFLFSNITGYNYSTDNWRTKQWLWAPDASEWTINSEYTSSKTDFGTAVIYLVLDCSSSMNYTNIQKTREAVISFINKIYWARYN